MHKVTAALVAFALAGLSGAQDCPNSCSGHGECKSANCQCFDNWRIPDCSERECPHDLAFSDFPTSDGLFHQYAECSGRGICDRATGECDCFPGFTGKACRRHACPNDCSGHGTCERMKDLTFGPVAGTFFNGESTSTSGLKLAAKTYQETAERLWDYKKGMACKCDPEWTDVDCGRRMCPRGNDIMSSRLDSETPRVNHVQNITLYSAGESGNGARATLGDFAMGEFALTFVSQMNETFTTKPLVFNFSNTELGNDIASALEELPNNVVSGAAVNVTFQGEVDYLNSRYPSVAMTILVEFTGDTVQGTQNLLMVETNECLDGCTPKIKGLNLASFTSDYSNVDKYSFVETAVAADFNSYECGRRGVCDYNTGICECFTGYEGQSCQLIAKIA